MVGLRNSPKLQTSWALPLAMNFGFRLFALNAESVVIGTVVCIRLCLAVVCIWRCCKWGKRYPSLLEQIGNQSEPAENETEQTENEAEQADNKPSPEVVQIDPECAWIGSD